LDKNFIKYIPDGFLDEAQFEAKRKALAADSAKGKGNHDRLALPDEEVNELDMSSSVGNKRKGYKPSPTERKDNIHIVKYNKSTEKVFSLLIFSFFSAIISRVIFE
jgi:hypothetical protein